MKLHTGIKQDEDMRFYFALSDGTKHMVEPPTELRCVGKFFPKPGEELYRIERLDPATGIWTSLRKERHVKATDRLDQE